MELAVNTILYLLSFHSMKGSVTRDRNNFLNDSIHLFNMFLLAMYFWVS